MAAASDLECVRLTRTHLDAAFDLSSIAGWNQTRADWQLLLDLPGACLGIAVEGRLAATATLVCYGQELGWVGMVLTHPDFRRRGFAHTLVRHVMEHAASIGLPTLKLDATDDGRPLYESFGFRAEQAVQRWQRTRPGSDAPVAGHGPASWESCNLDRHEFPERVSDDAIVTADGYVLSRPGRVRRYLGPCSAVHEASARNLIEEMVARHPDSGWLWDLLPANAAAVRIASALGFEPVRHLTRMVWGKDLRGQDNRIFAIGGFEFG